MRDVGRSSSAKKKKKKAKGQNIFCNVINRIRQLLYYRIGCYTPKVEKRLKAGKVLKITIATSIW